MTDRISPLPDELATLIEAERALPQVDPARRARIRSAVEAAIPPVLPPAPTATDVGAVAETAVSGAWSGYALAGAIGLVVGGVVGAAIHAAVTEPSTPAAEQGRETPSQPLVEAVDAVDAGTRDDVAPDAAALDGGSSAIAHPTGQPAGATRSGNARVPSEPAPADTLSHERRLLDAARAAIVRGHPEEGLRFVSRHEQRFAEGQLAEEREVLAVQALVLAGRADEARVRASRFRQEHPGSFMVGAVERALRATPPDPAPE